MKAFSIFLLCLFLSITTYSQKKSGTVYSDHEAITKTRELWKAFEAGDANAFLSFLSDTVIILVNGKKVNSSKERTISYINYYKDNFDNVKIKDAKYFFPDAIKFKNSPIIVQDWVDLTGVHRESGIFLDLHVHHLYSFNEEGKISSLHYYFNNDKFEEIHNSGKTRENGKIFINHPHISTVRKLMNAFREKDIDKWATFYSPKVRFGDATMKHGVTNNLETQIEELKNSHFFKPETKFKITQVGYPDCMYYAKEDDYIVYSWWLYTEWAENKIIEVPFLAYTIFDKDGKIVYDFTWYSSNHFKE